MKQIVDSLSAVLADRYIQYIETLLVDIWSDRGTIEFRCGFSLRRDHVLRRFTLRVPAMEYDTDAERELLIVVIFEQIQDLIDEAIAENRVATN